MDKQLKEEALSEAIRIGDELISFAQKDKNGLSWSYLVLNHQTNVSFWLESDSIYSGNSGIILFLIELYNVTKHERFKQAAIEGMKRVNYNCKEQQTSIEPFYTGQMGVSFVMLRLYIITGDQSYLEKALKIAKNSLNTNFEQLQNDILTGTAGILLCLLHIFAATEKDWVLNEIKILTKLIIQNAYIGSKSGIYWDRFSTGITRGLCGFSHGAAGIGFVFLELGNYFNNKAFFKIADEAFTYENHYWNKNNNNWPDFRFSLSDDATKNNELKIKAYHDKNWGVFYKTSYLNAWCHGAVGIGLSRLRAYELLKNKQYKKNIKNAISLTVSSDINNENTIPNFTLCHALGGNAELFIQAEKIFGDKKYESYLAYFVKKFLNYNKIKKLNLKEDSAVNNSEYDPSLFIGNAGIGYFLLRAVASDIVPSILAPIVNTKTKKKIYFSQFQLKSINKSLLEKQYKRSICVIEKLLPTEFNNFLKKQDAFSNRNALRKFIQQYHAKLAPNHQRCLKDIFGLESKIDKIENANSSLELLSTRQSYETRRIVQLFENDEIDFINQKFNIMPYTVCTYTMWDWSSKSKSDWIDNLSKKAEKQFLIIYVWNKKINEKKIPPVTYMLFEGFKQTATVLQVLKQTTSFFCPCSDEDKIIIEENLLEQIKEVAISGVLMRFR